MTPFTIGRVLGARGLGGELRLQTFRSDPAYFRAKKLTLVPSAGPPSTFRIQSLRSTDPKTHVVALEGLSDRTAAEGWIGAKVELSAAWFAPGEGPLESLMGARSCQAAFPGAKKGFALVVISDELKIPLPKKEDIKDYKEKTYDSPDAFLYKVERKGKTYYAGWWEKKVGKPTLRCNSIASEGGPDFDFDFERATIELCRTLASSGL